MQLKEIQQLIEPTIRAMGLELWECRLNHQGHRSLLQLYIDGGTPEKSVNLDDCVAVSREVGALLDVEDPIKNRYQLEVSSPGIQRPLSTLSHFSRYVGHCAKVRLRAPQGNHRQFIGKIERVTGDSVVFMVDQETIQTSIRDIQKATLEI